MSETLLKTKFYVPAYRPNLVSRQRLIEKLNEGLAQKLTLVSAPAGFGKTTIISHWLERFQNDQAVKVAWLSLDEEDNDTNRFLTYFISALNKASDPESALGNGALSMLESPQPPSDKAVLTVLINKLAESDKQFIFVLDDYHLIDSKPIEQAVGFLLDNLPPQLHLLIATRQDPALSLGRLRARDQVTEIRATDLRFSESEAADFLSRVMGLNLSSGDIAELESRTEGWIAGLQLAAISLQGGTDVSAFVKSFTGSHRLVLDYLIEEVLGRQPEIIQNFLLQTSILNRLTGSLCDALSGQNDGQQILETLERANLFIVPLDNKRHWYRYHHLFADLLRQRLGQKQQDLTLTLHRRASEWYEQKGLTNEAIEHALHANDFEGAANLLEEQVDALWSNGEHHILKRWLAKFPSELLFSRPHLCVFHSWYHFAGGNQDAADYVLKAAEEALEASSDIAPKPSLSERNGLLPDVKRTYLQGKVFAIRAFMDSYRGDVSGMIINARQALDLLPEQDLPMRSFAAIALGDAYTVKGEMKAAYIARLEAIEVSRSSTSPYFQIAANLKMVMTLKALGQLHRAVDVCQQQYKLAETNGLSQVELVGLLLAEWGEVLAEFNDLDGAIDWAQRGIELTERGADLSVLGRSYRCMMRVLFSRGDAAGAEKVVQKMETISRKTDFPLKYMNHVAAWQTRFWLAQNELEAASQWANQERLYIDRENNPLHELGFLSLVEFTSLVRVRIAQDQWDEAFRLLSQLLEAVETGEHTLGMIEIHMLQALAFQASGDSDQSVGSLERALTMAEPLGFLRIFVDEGPLMAQLLYEALNRGIAPEYVQRLLAAFPVTDPKEDASKKSRADQSGLIEPLSEREIEVLQFLAKGLTNQVVATRLFISLHTVKTHTRNIYSKLGVNNRTQAVDRARTLGILPPI